jgi:hypothetical protein
MVQRGGQYFDDAIRVLPSWKSDTQHYIAICVDFRERAACFETPINHIVGSTVEASKAAGRPTIATIR